MSSLNQVTLIGNLTRDIELRFTPSGLAVAQLGLAMNHKFRDSKTNELREEVTFVDVDVMGKSAENAHQYLAKGSQVLVQGRLKLDQWTDKQSGQKRSKLKVFCEKLTFLNSKRDANGGQQQRQTRRPPTQQHQDDAPVDDLAGVESVQEQDIPF